MWIPEAGSARVDGGTYDQMPFWAVRKAAVALGVCPEDGFVDREGEEGTYEGFPGYETYNETLTAIEEAGLKHGREPVTPAGETVNREQHEQDAGGDSIEAASTASDLDRAHLREKNRLLLRKVDRLESALAEKTDRIEDLEADVQRLRAELATVRSERDRLETALETREFEQDPEQGSKNDTTEGRSPLDKVRQLVSFDQ